MGYGLSKFRLFAKAELEIRDSYAKAYNHDFTRVDSTVLRNYTKHVEAVKEKSVLFIKKNPNLLYSIWLFTYEILGNPRYSKHELLDIYDSSLKSLYHDTFEEKLIIERLSIDRLATNTMAPLLEKSFKDLQGSIYSISSYRGKMLLVNIWATWCVPCVAEIPRLKQIYSKYKPFVDIFSFSMDSDEKKLRNFLKVNDINWVNVFSQPEICQAFGSDMGIPQLFLIDEKGLIKYSKSESIDNNLDILDKTLSIYSKQRKLIDK